MLNAMPDPSETAREVLRTEAGALLAMADALPEGFAAVIDLLQTLDGRTIVSGIGKSGHIARKIAATLASTGTPALFVHPAEASHGDLGMITRHDAVILISNSGETAELRDILAHTRRFNVPTVAISSNPASTLATTADHALVLPRWPEACGIGMVPTTSTTLTLALGDAIAVALLRRRNFRAEDFSVFHPGGKLGAQMARVRALMHAAVPEVCTDTPMSEALIAMTAGGFGIAAVTQGGRLAGVVTDGDLRRNMAGLLDRTAGEVATRDPVTVPPDMLAAKALAVMNERKVSALIVVEDGRPAGVLHVHDLLRAGVA
ncbi:SIS domain-containing protein [Jannaschia sp. W003]|uniref:KpsF/GutQ family sugar-phosphate isomerase n=1 Tax=Jannaschia sp. W003 TaxID=2867012 RepID=UPI0021A41849|nr:KpsF/GutQ family sugar-phosphate isomerase [Jannaschia sp. W003]UWQ21725.1 KpsF/GutQ family sugar-phosphate isomerase [Jannaschia sp. W003]